MSLVRLIDAQKESLFGGKAASLATALRASLPVPTGFALSHRAVDAILEEDTRVLTELRLAFSEMKTPIAARSSAVGEDSIQASFAGQHASILNVASFAQLLQAIRDVSASAETESTRSYRKRLGVEARAQMGIVLQELIAPDSAGVLFTQNPVSGADEIVIESAWGLGEIVVAGLVIPDYFRLAPDGTLLERRIGEKDTTLRILPDGGTEEVAIATEKANAPTLSDEDLEKLLALSAQCETVYGKRLDIEWCFAEGKEYLLQCRAITVSGS